MKKNAAFKIFKDYWDELMFAVRAMEKEQCQVKIYHRYFLQ